MTNDSGEIDDFRIRLLGWYDKNHRKLPWRTKEEEGATASYFIWLSEVMLQQTTVAAVIPYFLKFTEKWPTIFDLASAEETEVMQDWAGLGYYARARNLIKCARIVATEYNGQFPQNIEILKTLPGIGDYTSASIAAIAYCLEANVVDGNVERVMARYHAITDTLPKAKGKLKTLAGRYTKNRLDRTGDYAQALMDLGATICTPNSPLCALCPINNKCEGYLRGIAETLPQRAAKIAKPNKIGNVFWITNNRGEILIEKRPETGLLGGMIGLPTSKWILAEQYKKQLLPNSLDIIDVREINFEIKHTFTHFNLTLRLYKGRIDSYFNEDPTFQWISADSLKKQGFPTVFKKAIYIFLNKLYPEGKIE